MRAPDIGCHKTFSAVRVRTCRYMVEKHGCQLFANIRGTDKNTGEPVDRWGCMDANQNMLQIETQSVMREVAGEVSMHRKENLDQGLRIMENQKALDANLITMHGQNAQIALAQIRSNVAQLNDDEPPLPFLEHRANG
jgi:hypothetical protein